MRDTTSPSVYSIYQFQDLRPLVRVNKQSWPIPAPTAAADSHGLKMCLKSFFI